MTKIMKYLKPYWLSIVLALGLLFGQATCELTMPDYMQNIVNTGIQNGGIESGVYEQVRESTFNSYVMFATDSEKDLMTSSYKLVTPSKATKENNVQIPQLLMMNGMDTYRKAAKSEISKLGDSTVTSMSSQFLKKEYSDLGMDMEKIQQDYIIYSGL